MPGSPLFQPGHKYFLYLREKSENLWAPSLLAFGDLEEVRGVGGAALLVPVPELGLSETLPRPDGRPVEPSCPGVPPSRTCVMTAPATTRHAPMI